MALTKVSGPLLDSSNNNLGNYVINNITGAAATFTSLDCSNIDLSADDLKIVGIITNSVLTPERVVWVGTGNTLTESDNLTWDNTNIRLKSLGITSTRDLKVTGISTVGKTVFLSGQNPNIRFDDSDTDNNGEITLDNTQLRIEVDEDNAVNSSALKFRVDGGDVVTINSDGEMGVGTNNPDAMLHVAKSVSTAYNAGADSAQRSGTATINVENNDGTTNSFAQLAFDTAGSNQSIARIVALRTGSASNALAFVTEHGNTKAERLRIASGGNVGIGTTTPGAMLHITKGASGGATANTDSSLILDNSSHTYITFRTPADKEQGVLFGDDADNDAGAIVYDHSDNALTFATNGGTNERLRIGSTGISTFTNDVRIVKTAGPLLELTTNTGAADATLRLSEGAVGSTSNGGGMYYSGADNKLHITCGTDSTTKRISILRDTGLVGIGTDNPARKVEIFDTAATVLQLNSTNTGGTSLRIQNSGTDKMYMGLAGDFIVGQTNNVTDSAIRASGALLVSSGGGDERLRIDSTGRLGIGDASPTVAVSIKHTAPKIKFIDSDATGTPETLVDGSGGDLILDVDKDDEKGSTLFAVKLDGSEKLRINSSGQVGINTVTWWDSACPLSVYNGVTGREHTIIDILADTNETSRISFSEVGDTNKGSIRYSHGNLGDFMSFHTNGTGERLRITSQGRVNIGEANLTQTSTSLNVTRNAGGTVAGESVIAATCGNDTTMVSALLTVRNAGNRGARGHASGSKLVSFEFNDHNAFLINKDGHIGIGTIAPVATRFSGTVAGCLHLRGTKPSFYVSESDSHDPDGKERAIFIGLSGGNAFIGANGADGLQFLAGNGSTEEKLRITSNGLTYPIPGKGCIQGEWKYRQQNQSQNFEHVIRGPLGNSIHTDMDGNAFFYISVGVTGTGTGTAWCEYHCDWNSSEAGATLTHVRGNNSASSNRPFMILDNNQPYWKMDHATAYTLDIRVVMLCGKQDVTFTTQNTYGGNP